MSRLSRVLAPKPPAAVLWDMDGTLVDTEPSWVAAEHAIVEEAGGRWSEELAAQLIGQDLRVSAEFIRANSPVTDDPEDIIERATANWMRRYFNRQPVVTAIVVDA